MAEGSNPPDLAELISLYQAKLQESKSHSSQISNESLESVYKLQNVLRQSSVLYNAICKCDHVYLCAFLLSGNINVTTKEKKPFFTRAFKNQNFVNQSTYLITFLRENLHFTASLFFTAIENKIIDAKFISFSTIPTLFQNGWCVEEDMLWSTFLSCYLRKFETISQIDPNSPLFFPFKAFFFQKLSLDYLQLSLAPVLQSFIDDQDIPALRVNFEFDATHMQPKQYIIRIQQAGNAIIKNLELHLDRVPLSVRRLLTQISASMMKIGFNQYSDVNLANFFFVNCCVVPVILEPHLIGLDAAGSPQFVFDDLANLFFFSNFMNVRFPPPFVFSMTAVLNTKHYSTRRLVESLIISSNSEPIAEFHESLFQLASDRYTKSVNFMPLDLFYIHKAFVKFSETIGPQSLDENGMKSLKSFEFLLQIDPEIQSELAFNMFTQQMKTPAQPTPLYTPQTLSSIERCYKVAFSNLPIDNFHIMGPEKAMAFELSKAKNKMSITERIKSEKEANSDTEFAVALSITYESFKKDPQQIYDFLKQQIESLDKAANADRDLAVDVKLALKDIQTLYKRTLQLCTQLTSAAIRILIHYLIKNHCLQRIAYFDANKNFYAHHVKEFYDLYNAILKTCNIVITRTVKIDKVDQEMRNRSIQLFRNILLFTLVDRISISSFIEFRSDYGEVISTIISEMKWNSDPRVQEALKSAEYLTTTSKVNILMRGVELLINAVNSSTISMAFHLILKAVSTVLLAIGKTTNKVRLGCLIWVVLHTNIENLFYIYKFINLFYGRSDQLVDICGNENVRYWKMFSRIFEMLAFQARDQHRRQGSIFSDSDQAEIAAEAAMVENSQLQKRPPETTEKTQEQEA